MLQGSSKEDSKKLMGLRLRSVRLNAGDTREEAAKKIGVSVDSIRSWEEGKRFMRLKHIKAFCIAYHISADYLIGNQFDRNDLNTEFRAGICG